MEQVCRELEVSRSGYYDWLKHEPSHRERDNQALKRRLIEPHEKYPAMGLDSLYHMVKPEFGCSRKRVHRQMRLDPAQGLQSHYKLQPQPSHRAEPSAKKLLF